MNKEQQIEEMARDICECYNNDGTCWQDGKPCDFRCESMTDAQYLYEKGYRKQSEGEWLILKYERFTCSKCDYDFWHGYTSRRAAKQLLADCPTLNYCPNCGARMKRSK